MALPSNDADAERLVRGSWLVGAARRLLSAAELVAARSVVVSVLARPWPARTVARVIAIASLVHGAIVTFVPAAAAPFGRYLFAALGLAAAALVAAAARAGENDVRHLR